MVSQSPNTNQNKDILKTMGEVTKTARLQHWHLLLWVGIFIFAAALMMLVASAGSLFASTPDVVEDTRPTLGNTITVTVDVRSDGSVQVGDKTTHRVLQPMGDFDEFKYKLLDKPGTYLDRLQVRVNFANPLPQGTTIRSFAVHGIDAAEERIVDDHTLEYTASGIESEAVYTITAKIPAGSISWPLWRRILGQAMVLPLGIWLSVAAILPLMTLLVLVFMFWPIIRARFFRPQHQQITEPPAHLPPAVVGILVHGRVSSREIAATLIDLANRGYLSIFKKDKDHFSFAKRRAWQGLSSFELILLTQLFTTKNYKSSVQDVEISVGANLFSPEIAKVYLSMYDTATSAGYFRQNPGQIHRRYRLIGLMLFFVGLAAFLTALLLNVQPPAVLVILASMMVMALIIIIAADDVPLLTHEGEIARQQWLDFRNYLASPELVGYLEGSQAFYERYLPYAVVLKTEVVWLNRFRDYPFRLPLWYDSVDNLVKIEDFAQGLYKIVGDIAEVFAAVKEPTVH